jgi:DNA-binding transcriptional MerR regulator
MSTRSSKSTGEGYTLGELAERGSTPERTIRFYATEGLLPPPRTRGRYATYTDDHLNRLRLIAKLKRAYLPLAAIRDQLAGLTEEQVATLAADSPASEGGAGEQPVRVQVVPPTGDPAAYVSQILEVTGQAAAGSRSEDMPPRRALLVSSAFTPQHDTGTDEWRRIPIAEGVELHVRLPLDAGMAAKLDRLTGEARRLLSGE